MEFRTRHRVWEREFGHCEVAIGTRAASLRRKMHLGTPFRQRSRGPGSPWTVRHGHRTTGATSGLAPLAIHQGDPSVRND